VGIAGNNLELRVTLDHAGNVIGCECDAVPDSNASWVDVALLDGPTIHHALIHGQFFMHPAFPSGGRF